MNRVTRPRCGTLLVAIGLAIAGSGCSSPPSKNTPILYRVKGRVTLDGQPLPDARVIFTLKGGGRSVYGQTTSSGHYDLAYSKDHSGTTAGDYVVSIRTGRDPEENPNTGDESPAVPETLPSIYNAKSTLTAKVPDGDYDFDLNSTTTQTTATPVAPKSK